jgi:hypothetical protein
MELAKRTPDSLLAWSLAHRRLQGGPMRLPPALRELYDDGHPTIVVQKAAQVFVSEYLINTALWVADSLQGRRGNALFVMPTQTQVNDFSQARLDKAIGESPYLQQRLSPPPPGRAGPMRQNLKKIGNGYIYLRGSDSQKQLTSVDADVVLLDEYDLMAEGVFERAQKRLASSRLGWMRVASTPRLPEAGINDLFLRSDQRYYFIRCAACNHEQRLVWPDNIDLKKGILVCARQRCRKPLNVGSAAGRWEPAAPGNAAIHGYHLNRLYSPLANIPQMIRESTETTPAAVQEFQNSVLGETYVPPGGQLTIDILDRCRRDDPLPEAVSGVMFMGVDVGTKMHTVVRHRLDDKRTRLVFAAELDSFEQVQQIALRYGVECAVVDAQPEQRAAREFALRGPFLVVLARYSRSEPGENFAQKDGVNYLQLSRTEALEELFHAFNEGTAELPRDARRLGDKVRDGIGEYYREMMALVRVMEQDATGNWVTRFIDKGKADHYAHAELYCQQAMRHRGPRVRVFDFGD